jgi:TP901 family phage tail tape measure protein
MSRMSLDTAIRLSAEVKGGGNIDRVKRSLQDLGKGGQTTRMDMVRLEVATRNYARANDNTIAGLRNSINAFRGLQEQAKIGSREFQRYGAEVQKLEAKLRGLDGTAEKAGASLGQKLAAGLAAAGIGRGLQQITMQAANFDAELRKAAAIEGGAGSFNVLRKEIEAVAAVAAGTPTEVAALATALSRAGFSADQTTKALRGIVLGAEATDTAFDQMGSIVGTVLKTFQMDASQTASVVDVMVKSANSANQTVADVGEAMSYAAGEANTLGVSVEDTAAVIALLADASIRGSRGGTTFATGLNRLQIAAGGADSEMQELIKGSAKMADAMGRLGAEVLDAQGNLKPLDQVLIAIKRQMDGMSATDKAIISKALFGAEAGRGFQAILARTEEDIIKMFRGINDAGGTAEQTREKMRGFGDSLTILGGNVQNVTNQIGGMIGAALKPLVDALNAALGVAAKLPEPVKMFGAAAAAAGLSVLGLVVAVNALKVSLGVVGGIQAMTAALTAKAGAATAATGAVKMLTAALAIKTLGIGALVVGLGIFVAALIDAATKNDRFRKSIRDGSVDTAEGRKRLAEMNTEIDALQRRLASTANPRLMQSLKGQIRRAREEARLLSQELEIASFYGEQGRARGGSPQAGEMYQPGVGYFDVRTGRFTRGDDAARPGANALGTPIGSTITAGAGGSGGGGGSGSAPKFELSSRGRALVAAAQKLGVSPLDLATIISYETSGTFSPSIPGGQGGNYMGLIQFGPTERQQYGAHPGQSFEEQVTGPVVRYFEDRFRGVGMSTQGASLLDLYTTVLAGNPKANRNARDSFGTSPQSGVGRMEPHRQKALSTFFGGSMENVGFGALDQAQAANAAFEDFQQRQKAATADLEKFVEARTQSVAKLNQESELLKATTDYDRRRLEYAFEQNDINDRHNQIKRDFEILSQRLLELGIEYNAEQQLARIEAERQQALKNAQIKAEQEINDLMVERTRMMQQITREASNAPVFQTQSMKIEDQIGKLKEDLQEMTSIATLASKSAEGIGNAFGRAFQDLITGAASARQVLSNFFLDVAKNFAQMAAEIIAKQMQMVVLQTILKALGAVAGAAGGGADFAPSDTGPFGGAGLSTALSFDPSNLVPRALGGSTATGRPYKVGENGPELFVPYQAGTIIPAEATEALEAINNASLRGLQVPFQSSSSSSSGLSVPFQRGGMEGLSVPFQRGGMEGLSVPFQRGGMDGSAAGGGGGAVIDVKFETVRIGELDFVTKDEAQRIGRESAKQGAALAQKRITNNPSTRRQAGIG